MKLCRMNEKSIMSKRTLSRQEQTEFAQLMAEFVGAVELYLAEANAASGSN